MLIRPRVTAVHIDQRTTVERNAVRVTLCTMVAIAAVGLTSACTPERAVLSTPTPSFSAEGATTAPPTLTMTASPNPSPANSPPAPPPPPPPPPPATCAPGPTKASVKIGESATNTHVLSRVDVAITMPGYFEHGFQPYIRFFVRHDDGSYYPAYAVAKRLTGSAIDTWQLTGVQLGSAALASDRGSWQILATFLDTEPGAQLDRDIKAGKWTRGQDSLPAGSQQLKTTLVVLRVC